ncbi:MAG: HmuY family protein [Nitrospinaceae bacterium]
MSEEFPSAPPDPAAENLEKGKKHKMWRNLFIFNLCVTLLLIGLFWVPLKFVQLNQFLESSSIDSPRKTGLQASAKIPPKPQPPKNALPANYVVINATSDEEWRYFDFSRGQPVEIFDRTSLEWDLAFRRGKIITNGGATNKFGQGGVMDLGEVDFDSVNRVPPGQFVEDKSTRTATENGALAQWYKYNYITHKLTARKNVYIFRTAHGRYSKAQFLGFYCPNDEPGCIQMRFVYQQDGSDVFLKPKAAAAAAAGADAAMSDL